MAKALIWTQQPPTDRLTTSHERGDVVDVHWDDFWHFGRSVHGPERLLAPDGTPLFQEVVIDCSHYRLAPMLSRVQDPKEQLRPTYRVRQWRVDLDKMLADGRVFGDPWTFTPEQFLMYAAIKPEARQTAIIGGSRGN